MNIDLLGKSESSKILIDDENILNLVPEKPVTHIKPEFQNQVSDQLLKNNQKIYLGFIGAFMLIFAVIIQYMLKKRPGVPNQKCNQALL